MSRVDSRLPVCFDGVGACCHGGLCRLEVPHLLALVRSTFAFCFCFDSCNDGELKSLVCPMTYDSAKGA